MTHLGLPIKLFIALSFPKKLSFLISQVKLETLLLKNMERKFNLRFFEILLIMSHFYPLFHGMTHIQYWCIDVKYRIMWRGLKMGERRALNKSFQLFCVEPHKFYTYHQYNNPIAG